MEWNEKLQLIIDYIENHLQRDEEEMSIEDIEQIAGCSFSFFQKVFSYMNNISFSEYIRFRKMTLAGYDLKSTDMKVVEISYKYGYDSPTSFTKAFQQFHGVSPREARHNHAELKVFAKMQVHSIQEHSWKLEQKHEFRLIGKTQHISCDDEMSQQKILEFWSECQRDGTFVQLISMDHAKPQGMFGVFQYKDNSHIEYSITVISDAELPQGFVEIIIPKVTWAVFDCQGPIPESIQKGWRYLTQEWIVQYPFQHAKCPELEWYSSGNTYSDDYLSQIWIPILENIK